MLNLISWSAALPMSFEFSEAGSLNCCLYLQWQKPDFHGNLRPLQASISLFSTWEIPALYVEHLNPDFVFSIHCECAEKNLPSFFQFCCLFGLARHVFNVGVLASIAKVQA
jgi:hypothetical protein